MKLPLLFGGAMLALTLNSAAQITINRSDWGNLVGSAFVQARDTTNLNLFSPGNAGANQTWNLAAVGNDSQDTTQILSPANTICAASFPNATMAVGSTQGASYIHDNNSVFELVGICGMLFDTTMTSIPINPPQKIFTFPSTYNTSFAGESRMSLVFPGIPGFADSIKSVSITSFTSLIDGWGTLITPAATYPALRQKYITSQTDSSYFLVNGVWQFAGGEVTATTNTTYNWWNQHNLFAATMDIDENGNVTNVLYLLSTSVGITETPDLATARVFPNPSNGKFTVATSRNITAISVYDVMGRQLFTTSGIQQNAEIDLSMYPKGVYFVKIHDGATVQTEKIVLQ